MDGRALAARIGRLGIWSFHLDLRSAGEGQRFAAAAEALGYGALWYPESVVSKEAFAQGALLLSATRRIVVATGIASLFARDPVAMRNGERALADAFPGRFLLGIGVSHEPAVRRRGGVYERPLERMREYLDAMDRARYAGPEPAEPAPRVLAALGPKMLELAAERTAGAHPYFVPVEHTSFARKRLGPEPLLAVEQAAVLETDPAKARERAREHMKGYLRLDNYANNLRRMGWSQADIDGPTDALVDAIVAHGDVEKVRARVKDHWARGADHVCVQFLNEDPLPPLAALRKALPT
ncbi:MAG TPA: TIGR03620 family F420-dependent LLM class oxidoreductase [Candidatus Limnocylindria bacterium]|nr:TIGR03620 family F420-dependent LLM class oxidoreductase [Candidatus Limnocylindria bacterium]